MIFGDGYADNSGCDWRSGLSILIMVAVFLLGWSACANFGLWLGEMVGHPAACVVVRAFGVPILAILINGHRR